MLKNAFTEWMPPHSSEDENPGALHPFDVNTTASQFQFRHLIYVPVFPMPGAAAVTLRNDFEWQIYRGEDYRNPEYVYIRQKVMISVIVFGQGGLGILGGYTSVGIIPGPFTVETTIINDKPTSKYVPNPAVDNPYNNMEPDSNNPPWNYVLGGTEFSEQFLFEPPDNDDDVNRYILRDGEFLRWASGGIYQIDIPPEARFSVVNPPEGVGDGWSVPNLIRNSTYHFRWKLSKSANTDSYLYNEMTQMEASNESGVTVIRKGSRGAPMAVVGVMDTDANPSISRDEKGRIWMMVEDKNGQWVEYLSESEGSTRQPVNLLWGEQFNMGTYIYLREFNLRATTAISDNWLHFSSSRNNFNYTVITKIPKEETYALSYDSINGTMSVLNRKGSGFYSKDLGSSWNCYNGLPANVVEIQSGSNYLIPCENRTYKGVIWPQNLNTGWYVYKQTEGDWIPDNISNFTLGTLNNNTISVTANGNVDKGQKYGIINIYNDENNNKYMKYCGVYVT